MVGGPSLRLLFEGSRSPVRGWYKCARPAVPWRGVVFAVALCLAMVAPARALDISNHWSPKNKDRPRRKSTTYIILHTTEGATQGSLRKVCKYGETHYFVDTKGHVCRIVDRNLVALHAGRSMWNGTTVLDNYAIGIEVVGYHNKPITASQTRALRELIEDLQRIYTIPDDRVLTHSMVAYGSPNRWHRRSHRGRKRCGMLFAIKAVRRSLGLDSEPAYDPDVKAGRLVNGDPYLASVLYGRGDAQEQAVAGLATMDDCCISASRSAWDIARDAYNRADTLYTFPDGTTQRGNEITDWGKIPPGTKVAVGEESDGEADLESVKELGVDGQTPMDIAGDESVAKTTIYFLSDGRVKCGDEFVGIDLSSLPAKTMMLVGYIHGGSITATRRAFDVCGKRWNFPSTFYRFPDGDIKPGNKVDEGCIPKGTLVFFQN